MEQSRRLARAVALGASLVALAGALLVVVLRLSLRGFSGRLLPGLIIMLLWAVCGAVLALVVGRRGGGISRGVGMFVGGMCCAAAFPLVRALNIITGAGSWRALAAWAAGALPGAHGDLFLPLLGWALLLAAIYSRGFAPSRAMPRVAGAIGLVVVMVGLILGILTVGCAWPRGGIFRTVRLVAPFALCLVAFVLAAVCVFQDPLRTRLRYWTLLAVQMIVGLEVLFEVLIPLAGLAGGSGSLFLSVLGLLAYWAMALGAAYLAVIGLGDLFVNLLAEGAPASPYRTLVLQPIDGRSAMSLEQRLQALGALREAGEIDHEEFQRRRRALLAGAGHGPD
jgi:putative oligomerization/nucleic acid binding protein